MQLLAQHSNVTEDMVSERLRHAFKACSPIANVSDAELADRIISDCIDILIDLSGHTAHNRMPAFVAAIRRTWRQWCVNRPDESFGAAELATAP